MVDCVGGVKYIGKLNGQLTDCGNVYRVRSISPFSSLRFESTLFYDYDEST